MKKLMNCDEKKILEMLVKAGYEGYFVGGCVRDTVMERLQAGSTQHGSLWGDVDVATNALPHQVQQVFEDYQVIPTGIRHGTVTVLLPKDNMAGYDADRRTVSIEVTTYRSDGAYSDSRHPDRVEFLTTIEEDLARRDFTINAMACDINGKLVDPHGGAADLAAGIIRAVGDADARFREDALRIMRALRFASVLEFDIEDKTEKAIFRHCRLLAEISPERIFSELKKLVAAPGSGRVIRKYVDVLGVVMPELLAMKGFQQHNPYHKYDVLEHCVRAMEAVRTTTGNCVHMRLAALFHDMGKPETYFMDEAGIGHFYGHPKKSEELVRRVLGRLKADRSTTERIAVLVKYHDLLFEKDERILKRWMNRLTPEVLQEILEIKLADNFATGNMSRELADKFDDIRGMMKEILVQQQCFSLKELAVKGGDLLVAGVEPGSEVGRLLNALLEAVIDGKCDNRKAELLELTEKLRAEAGKCGEVKAE